MGLGILSAYSRSRMPRPPQKRTTFISEIPFRRPHPEAAMRSSFVNLHGRNGNDELSAPFPDKRKLLHDLVLQVPRENKHIVWTSGPQVFRREDGDMRAGQKSTMLVRVAIHGEIQKILADAAVIQKR